MLPAKRCLKKAPASWDDDSSDSSDGEGAPPSSVPDHGGHAVNPKICSDAHSAELHPTHQREVLVASWEEYCDADIEALHVALQATRSVSGNGRHLEIRLRDGEFRLVQ